LVAPLFWAGARDAPESADSDLGSTKPTEAVASTSWSDFKALLVNPSLWLIGAAYFFLELCRYALMFWLPYYMVRQLHFGLQSAGYLSSLYELIGVGGAVFAGYVSDRLTQSRRAPVAATMLILLAVLMLFQPVFAHGGLIGMGIAISLAGFLSYGPDTLLSGAAAQDVGEARAAATASGLIDGIGHLGSLASPYLVVLASERYGWNCVFLIFAGTALLAGIVLLPLWNVRPADASLRSSSGPRLQHEDLTGKTQESIPSITVKQPG
jgi:sugar phosphate permease